MIHLTATSIGPIAAELLTIHHDVEVISAFERSFYLMAEGGLVCVGVEGIGRGPINITLADAEKIDWRDAGVFHEVKGQASAEQIVIGEDVTIKLMSAERWRPPAWARFEPARTQRGLADLRERVAGRLPSEGLAALVFAPGSEAARTPVARAATAQVAAVAQHLPHALDTAHASEDMQRALTLLLGLGTGLTPSGDDLIGGMFLALTALERVHLRDHLWEALTPELGELTTEISAMHLSAAADGLGAEAMHDLANAILSADARAVGGHLERVAGIGHTSGWDTLAGFALTLAAAQQRADAASAT